MNKIAVVFVLTLAGAFAQVSETQKPVPASQEDVQGLQRELTRMRREAKVAEKNATTRSLEERRKMLQENKVAIDATEKKLADKLESIERQARKTSDDQLRTQRIAWSVTGVVGLIGTLLLTLMIRKNQKSGGGLVVPSEPSQKREILIDPDIPALKEFSARNNGISKVPFILSLQDGQQFNCMAKLQKDGLAPLVYIQGSSVPVAWDKRRQAAAKISAT